MPSLMPEYKRLMLKVKEFENSCKCPENWQELDEFKVGGKVCKVLRIKGNPIERAKRKLANGEGSWGGTGYWWQNKEIKEDK